MFLGIEALDDDALRLHRKRVTLNENLRALEIARSLGLTVAINIIADPDWDEARFATGTRVGLTVPEIVHFTVATPYPGTELWLTESRQLTTARLPPLRRAARGAAHASCRSSGSTRSWSGPRPCSTASTWAGPRSEGRGGRAQASPEGRRTTFACCGSSRVYNPERQNGTTSSRCVTRCGRRPAREAVRPSKATLYVHAPAQPA